ncbi:carboxypeptidase-like regulatory domain-containing protein [Robiginitalea sp. M366]|uniref:carboxypeptidase-like regulatory domain-containing protein n=1 Tax=Robiginitalea aestuariiviva TaxID=3036903 RepID=UPI00240DF404|nr:carboxypeptidase-like regulatory domain-containing protein [Robiginitalea aestuariiviva]MDG1573064.1 carboxypeptidase-like regulatory domain-containing protein [Robiginitalea aestuariiviva]
MMHLRVWIGAALLLVAQGLWAQEEQVISGTITDGSQALQDVRISVEGSDTQVFTDAQGKYQVAASPGDLLMYSYTGMKEYRVRVEDVTRFLNLIMIPDIQELDEVTVTKSNRKSQADLAAEYRTNPNLIQTAYGIIDATTAPGKIRIMTDEQIAPIGLCVLDVIRNRFAGVWAVGDCMRGGYIVIRGPGSISRARVAMYDVDGQIFSDVPLWLDVNSIKRMAIVSSLAFNVRYGASAENSGGVIIINTVNGQAAVAAKQQDQARLKNNYVTGKVLSGTEVAQGAPAYLKALENAPTLEEAQKAYYEYEASYNASPYFYLDAFLHFSERSGGIAVAEEIGTAQRKKWSQNATLLKVLAYRYQELGMPDEALDLYKDIFILRPHYSQSYLDLARAYRAAGEAGKAAAMYARYKYLLDEGYLTASEEFGKIIQHESDNLLALEGRSLGADPRKVQTDPYVDGSTRVVVEWNDSEAEFDLQFVNPEGQYTTWKHTYADNEALILDEKDNGYSVAEFVIDENLPGTWKVNAVYHGNKSLTPTYVKITTYTRYGQRGQQQQVRTFRLQLKGVNQELLTLVNPGVSVVR